MCAETVQWHGGRAVTLSSQVHLYPGRIEVREPNVLGASKGYDAMRTCEYMIRLAGQRYGWWAILKTALIHLPLLRLFFRPNTDDSANGSMPFCSGARAQADRFGGYDPVRGLSDGATEPGDLARSTFYEPKFILE